MVMAAVEGKEGTEREETFLQVRAGGQLAHTVQQQEGAASSPDARGRQQPCPRCSHPDLQHLFCFPGEAKQRFGFLLT